MDHKPRHFRPFISSREKLPEFTLRATLIGILLGIVFGIGNAYIGLKIGQTMSASVSAAAIGMGISKLFSNRLSVLENNFSQTIASVGEAIAAGIIFIVPALSMLGEDWSPLRVIILSLIAGILGILFMIPIRRYIIVENHEKLEFPEGKSCAQILKLSEERKSNSRLVFLGVSTGAIYKFCTDVLYLWKETPSWIFHFYQCAHVSINCSPALVGAGFMLGLRTSVLVFVGGGLSWWVLNPLISLFGDGAFTMPSGTAVCKMSSDDIWYNYVRYIGMGAVGMAGFLSLIKIYKIIYKTFKASIKDFFGGFHKYQNIPRTDRDISMKWLLIVSSLCIIIIALMPQVSVNILTIFIFIITSFIFVVLTSIAAGVIGTTSSPHSAMTITFLLITLLIFFSLGWTERIYLISALNIGIVVSIIITIAGTTAQDLNTGYLLGATPRHQQVGEMLGVIFPVLTITGTIYLFSKVYVFGSSNMPAPQASMIALMSQGFINGNLPLLLLAIGAMISVLIYLLGLSVMPLALGLYLPLFLSFPFIIGGVVAGIVNHYSKSDEAMLRGDVLCSGLVTGDACVGVIISLFSAMWGPSIKKEGFLSDSLSLLLFLLLASGVAWLSLKRTKRISS